MAEWKYLLRRGALSNLPGAIVAYGEPVVTVDDAGSLRLYIGDNLGNPVLINTPQTPGPAGVSPVLTIGTITTLPAGTQATATLTGTSANPILNLGIPRGPTGLTGDTGGVGPTGDTGPEGPQGVGLQFQWNGYELGVKRETDAEYTYVNLRGAIGPTGATGETGATGAPGTNGTDGADGAAATIQVGTVTAGAIAAVTNRGTTNAAILDFVLPKGDKGDTGDTGATGQTPAFNIGTVTTLPAGNSATVTIDAASTATNVILNFGVPQGPAGSGTGDMLRSVYDSDLDGKVTSAVNADAVPWTGVSGKPTTFTPATHSHAITEITNLQTTLSGKEDSLGNPSADNKILSSTAAGVRSWVDLPNSAVWGSITGTLANQTDLNTALAGKAASTHAHSISDTTNLQTTLDGKAASSHTHTIANVTNLQTTLDSKAASTHSHAITDVTNLQTTLNGKEASLGNPDTNGKVLASTTTGTRSWVALPTSATWGNITGTLSSQTDLNTALAGKAASTHTHAISDTTNLQTTLDGKAASSHTHTIANVTNLQTTLDGKAASSHNHTLSNITDLTIVKGTGTFNSTTGRSITHNLGTSTYYVSILPNSSTGSTYIGEIYVVKSTNTMTVYCTGSTTTATFDYIIIK